MTPSPVRCARILARLRETDAATVNFADLVFLAQRYGQAGDDWLTGDFTGDGVTNFNDLVRLAQHYGYGTGGALEVNVSAPDWAAASSHAPDHTRGGGNSRLAGSPAQSDPDLTMPVGQPFGGMNSSAQWELRACVALRSARSMSPSGCARAGRPRRSNER
jgi:hypothetical protein